MKPVAILPALLITAFLVSLGSAQPPAPDDDQSIRGLIKAFADARNAHNGEAVGALYSADGEWISADGRTRAQGKAELVRMWNGAQGQVQRTVDSIDLPGNSIAVVRVSTQYWEPIGRHREVFILAKDHDQWRIRLHQSID